MRCNQVSSDLNRHLDTEGIKVYELGKQNSMVQRYSRKAFYKVSLLSGNGIIWHNESAIEFDGYVLLINQPESVCSWSFVGLNDSSYTCIFTQQYIDSNCFHWVEHSQLFASNTIPIYFLTDEQAQFITAIFHKMIAEQSSIYRYKNELMRDQLCVLLHLALQADRPVELINSKSEPVTVAARFIELAEMQFPLEHQVLYFN